MTERSQSDDDIRLQLVVLRAQAGDERAFVQLFEQFSPPFIIVLGVLSVLVGTLSTVGIFLRLRTASLVDIQLRLAALEDMLAGRRTEPGAEVR
jgi:uncharacterized membrane protein